MHKWGERSLENKAMLHPDLQILCHYVLEFTDCSIVCSHRGREEQNALFYQRPPKTKVKWPNSKHNHLPAQAVDLYMYPIKMNDYNRHYWFAGVVLATAKILKDNGFMTHSVRWGGDWDGDHDFKDQDFNDLVHFEMC